MINAQTKIYGFIKNDNDESLELVNIWVKGKSIGTHSDSNGYFELLINTQNEIHDTIAFSLIGYKSKYLSFSDIKTEKLNIKLERSPLNINEIIIELNEPINKESSALSLNQLDILTSPMASADPLKAISLLPFSTNTDEGSIPSLRGSSPKLSKVILNGIPLNNPIKTNSNNEGKGSYSLFNTGLIKRETVYASNPPILYSSTSGVVEIETINKQEDKSLDLTVGLSNIGLIYNNAIKNDNNFITIFGNIQFDKSFIEINKDAFQRNLKSFTGNDVGGLFHYSINNQSTISLYSYFQNEGGKYKINLFNYEDISQRKKTRNFNILNYRNQLGSTIISTNIGTDYINDNLVFGNMDYNSKSFDIYSSLGVKKHFNRISLQGGINYNRIAYKHSSFLPTYYFAYTPNSPSSQVNEKKQFQLTELYSYLKIPINNNLILGSGTRISFGLNRKRIYNGQLNLNYVFRKNHRILLSVGKYSSFSQPEYYDISFNPLKSNHYTLEYKYHRNRLFHINFALYYKNEGGIIYTSSYEKSDKRIIKGIELYINYDLSKYFNFRMSYTYLDGKYYYNNTRFKPENSLNYNVKLALSYSNLKVGTFSISYNTRPGLLYTPIIRTEYNNDAKYFQPIFSDMVNSKRLPSYNRIDLLLEKPFYIKKHSGIMFLSLSNLFNIKNVSNDLFNYSGSEREKEYYEGRIIYFGFNFTFDY